MGSCQLPVMAISAGNMLRVILGRISDLFVVIDQQGRSLSRRLA